MPLFANAYDRIKNYGATGFRYIQNSSGVRYVQNSSIYQGFCLGMEQSASLISFLKPIVTSTFAPLIYKTKAFFYSTSEAPPGASDTRIVPFLSEKKVSSESIHMVCTQSLQSNVSYLSKVIVCSSFMAPVLHFLWSYMNDEFNHIDSSNQDYNIIDGVIFCYLLRGLIDISIQNIIYAKLISSIISQESPFLIHNSACKEKNASCEHLHSCDCPTPLLAKADTDSLFYYLTNLKSISLFSDLGLGLGKGLKIAGDRLASWLTIHSSVVKNIYLLSNQFSKIASIAGTIGWWTQILADGWSIGEYSLSLAGTCTKHRYLKLRQNYPYYLGVSISFFLMNGLVCKPISIVTGINNAFISMPVSGFLFPAYVVLALHQTKPLPGKRVAPDVFYYHREITDKMLSKMYKWVMPKLNDPYFRKACVSYLKWPLKCILFIFLSANTKSLRRLVETPAFSLLLCSQDEPIKKAIYWLKIANQFPNAAKNTLTKALSLLPACIIDIHIKLLVVVIVKEFGIEKLIKMMEEALLLAHLKHPTMGLGDVKWLAPIIENKNHFDVDEMKSFYREDDKTISTIDIDQLSDALKTEHWVDSKTTTPVSQNPMDSLFFESIENYFDYRQSINKEDMDSDQESDWEVVPFTKSVGSLKPSSTPLLSNSLFPSELRSISKRVENKPLSQNRQSSGPH